MKKLVLIFLAIIAFSCSQKIVPPGERGPSLRSAKAVRGQVIFMKNCNRCHPEGMGGLGPSIINKPLPGFMIKFQVRNGLGAMPSFKKERLSKDDLNNLVAYIRERHRSR
jgi:mono/diheme cytochrome c family protein